jgi:hypothetical protein
MTETDTDEHRATGVWPTRPMTPFEPLPALRIPLRSRTPPAFQIAGRVIVALVLVSGAAFVLARVTGQI